MDNERAKRAMQLTTELAELGIDEMLIRALKGDIYIQHEAQRRNDLDKKYHSLTSIGADTSGSTTGR